MKKSIFAMVVLFTSVSVISAQAAPEQMTCGMSVDRYENDVYKHNLWQKEVTFQPSIDGTVKMHSAVNGFIFRLSSYLYNGAAIIAPESGILHGNFSTRFGSTMLEIKLLELSLRDGQVEDRALLNCFPKP